jgi:hypothetical protein
MGKIVDTWAKSWTSLREFMSAEDKSGVHLTMRKMKARQVTFYTLVLLFGFGYQPNWVYENFWSKAEFWNVLPFTPSYYLYLLIYAIISTLVVYYMVQIAKKYL